IEERSEPQTRDIGCDRFGDLRPAVADVHIEHPGHCVEELPSGAVPEPQARPSDHDCRGVVQPPACGHVVDDVPVIELDQLGCHCVPPSATLTASPLMPRAAGLARNATTAATSSGSSTVP